MIVNILGTEYNVKLDVSNKDKELENITGYTDETSKEIVVSNCLDCNYDMLYIFKNTVLRHEIIHAFLNESGLTKEICNWHCEEMVDWIAIQMPKIMEVYESIIKDEEEKKKWQMTHNR